MNPCVVMVMGVPGTGKTTFASLLSVELHGAPVLSTEMINYQLRIQDSHPAILDFMSHQAWRHIGPLTEANVKEGFKQHSFEIMKYSHSLCYLLSKNYRVIILEGVDILPEHFALFEEFDVLPVLMRNKNLREAYRKKETLRWGNSNPWISNHDSIRTMHCYLERQIANLKNCTKVDIGRDSWKGLIEVRERLSLHLDIGVEMLVNINS